MLSNHFWPQYDCLNLLVHLGSPFWNLSSLLTVRPFCILASFFHYFSLPSTRMTTSDGWTHTVRVGDKVHLLDDHQYLIPTFHATSSPIVLKKTNQSTYCCFLRTASHLSISSPQTVPQSTHTDPASHATDDFIACDILQFCGPAAVPVYHQGRPYCMGDIHCIALPEPISGNEQEFVRHKL